MWTLPALESERLELGNTAGFADLLIFADLGRTPDLIAKEFTQNNSLYSISYWKSLEDLEAWARRPVHLRGLRFLDFEVNKSGKPFDLGVVVSFTGHLQKRNP